MFSRNDICPRLVNEHKGKRREYVPMRFLNSGSTSPGSVKTGIVSGVGIGGFQENIEVPTTLFPIDGANTA